MSRKKKHKTDQPRTDVPPAFALGAVTLLIGVILFVHLAFSGPFSRHLLDLDDSTYVGALSSMSVGSYLSQRLWEPNALAFPVRDLTFILDFFLSGLFSFQIFIFTSVTLLCAYIGVTWVLFRRILPTSLALALLCVVALHPINVEVTQWVISRKHLLAGLFAMMAVVRTLALKRGESPITRNEYGIIFFLYALSILAHPPAVFLPLWVAVALWPQVRRAPFMMYCFVLGSLSCGGLWLGIQSTLNRDYGIGNASSEVASHVWLNITNAVMGLGRAVWQIFFPFRQAIYFDVYSPENIAGLAVFCGGLWLLIGHLKKHGAHLGVQLIFLSALMFVPQLLFTLGREDFIMADRFVFIPLPYLLAGVALCALNSEIGVSKIVENKPRLLFGTVIVALVCAVVSIDNVPLWRAELPLFKNCVDRANSDRCWWHYARELLKTGCPLVGDEWGRLTTQLRERSKDPHALFTPEGAIALSFCEVVSTNQSLVTRQTTVDELERDGGPPEALSFARNLLDIEQRRSRDALHRIVQLFLGPNIRVRALSVSVLGVTQGQLQALCDVGTDPACVDVLKTFRARFAKNQLAIKTIEFGYNATRRALVASPVNVEPQR